jgi:hypothetical protein
MMTREKLLSYLDEVEARLGDVVSDLRNFADMVDQDVPAGQMPADAANVSARMEAYIIPHLETWINDENQSGSIAEIRESLSGPSMDEEADTA